MDISLKYRKWPAKTPVGGVVLVHGMGAGTERWTSLARFFSERNVSSYALSLRGFDGTEGEKGYVKSFDVYHTDIKNLLAVARGEVPEGKIFLLGESMGALIAFDFASREKSLFDGYILLSPVFASKLKFSAGEFLRILGAMMFFPRKSFRMPFTAQMCTSDVAETKKIENDPAEHRHASGSLLREIFIKQVLCSFIAKRMTSPVLFLISMNDEIADPQKSIKVFDITASKNKTIKKYTGMKHALSVESRNEEVFEDICLWCEWEAGRKKAEEER
jgi:acylglycerol lipase